MLDVVNLDYSFILICASYPRWLLYPPCYFSSFSDAGFVGYRGDILRNNTGPDYLEGENFFTVFGVFFPTATGVFAGINMSGDLRDATKNIPVGTLSAVGVR